MAPRTSPSPSSPSKIPPKSTRSCRSVWKLQGRGRIPFHNPGCLGFCNSKKPAKQIRVRFKGGLDTSKTCSFPWVRRLDPTLHPETLLLTANFLSNALGASKAFVNKGPPSKWKPRCIEKYAQTAGQRTEL